MIRGVFFDLDGTLVDTAVDLVFSINQVLTEENKKPLPFAQLAPYVSGGSAALIHVGFGVQPSHPDFERLKQRFLTIYSNNLCNGSKIYPGLTSLLELLDSRHITWGIVTNKPEFLTLPLLKQLNLFDRAAIVISGDTYPQKKPDPYPLLQACQLTNINPQQAIYIGDDERDIIAANRAQMTSVCAKWGYNANQDVRNWKAEHYIEKSMLLGEFIENKLF